MLELQVRDGADAAFRSLMAEMAAATEANEPGTLAYEWYLDGEGRTCHLWERYADSAAALVHMGTFAARYAERFLAVLAPTRLTLYGPANVEVRAGLAAFGAVHLELAAGFSRSG